MKTYTIVGRNKINETVVLQANDGTFEIVNEGEFFKRFAEKATKIKETISNFISKSIDTVVKIGDKVCKKIYTLSDIIKANKGIVTYCVGGDESNNHTFEEYMRDIVESESKVNDRMLADLVFLDYMYTDALVKSRLNESVVNEAHLSNARDLRNLFSEIFGLKVDGGIDPEMDEVIKHGVADYKKRQDMKSTVVGVDYASDRMPIRIQPSSRDSDIEEKAQYLKLIANRFSVKGEYSPFNEAIEILSNYLISVFTSGTEGSKFGSQDMAHFKIPVLYGAHGIGKSAMFARIQELAKQGVFSEDGKTPYEYFNSLTNKKIVVPEIQMICIQAANADETSYIMPARDISLTPIKNEDGKLRSNGENNKMFDDFVERNKLTSDEVQKLMDKAGGKQLLVYDPHSEYPELRNPRHCTHYVHNSMTGQPSCKIPCISDDEYDNETDKTIPPTIVFIEELALQTLHGDTMLKSIIDSRKIAGYTIPSNVAFIGTSNTEKDYSDEELGADEEMMQRMISKWNAVSQARFIPIPFVPSFTEWYKYASSIDKETGRQKIHPYVLDFLSSVEHRFRFANYFRSAKESGTVDASSPRNWAHFSEQIYMLFSKRLPKFGGMTVIDAYASAKGGAEKSETIDYIKDKIINIAGAGTILHSDAEEFAKYVEGDLTGDVSPTFYKWMWDINKPIDDATYRGKMLASKDKDVYIKQYDDVGNEKENKEKTTLKQQVSVSSFAKKAVLEYPTANINDFIVKDGKTVFGERIRRCFEILYGGDKRFVNVGTTSDKSKKYIGNSQYFNKMMTELAVKYKKVLSESKYNVSDSILNNQRILLSCMLGLRNFMDKGGNVVSELEPFPYNDELSDAIKEFSGLLSMKLNN